MKVFVQRFDEETRPAVIAHALQWLSWERLVAPDARVFLKPNLTWREPMNGVTTTPGFLADVVGVLRQRTRKIYIGESDGGYHSFEAEDAFRSHHLYDIAERYGAEVVNLSDLPSERVSVEVAGRVVTVELPSLLLHDIDTFVSLPVPKVHVMTHVSLGFKNQWGCIPTTLRLLQHHEFGPRILAINKLLKPKLVLFDGTYFLDRTGPMIGEAVPMGLCVAADDLGAGSLVCIRIMGIDPRRVKHLRLAQREGMMPKSLKHIDCNQRLGPFAARRFRLERTSLNWLTLAAFHNRPLTRLFYDSVFAGPLHRILYAIRRNPLIARLLYGKIGPPTAEGGRRHGT